MPLEKDKKPDILAKHAVIYCRVSSISQKISGTGLQSQEHRCRQYAATKGYQVDAVFPDDVSGGGTFLKRPGMVALLSFLDAQPEKNYVVIFDDLKRFARDTQFHIALRQELSARGATVECLNFKFEDTPEGKFTETIFAAQGELEREQNRRQTIQKMRARLEKGYAVFIAPIGYRYVQTAQHGKLLVRHEPYATIIQEALEGLAVGRFQTQAEVKRFLESQPDWPKDLPGGHIRAQRVNDMVNRPIYAGMVEAPQWGISLRCGQHEGLISFETYQKVQDRLNGTAKAPARADINADFPLRGFLTCAECNKPLTASWSTSKTGKRHPYYWCKTRGCGQHRKSLRRADVEGAMEEVIQGLQPSESYAKLITAMFHDAWDARLKQAGQAVKSVEQALGKVERQIEGLLDRIIEASQPSVVAAYEKRIAALEEEKLLLAEKAANPTTPSRPFAEMFELSMRFLANPWEIWKNGSLAWKRTVLKLAFQEPVAYDPKEGIRTPKTTIPFKALVDICNGKCVMAEEVGCSAITI